MNARIIAACLAGMLSSLHPVSFGQKLSKEESMITKNVGKNHEESIRFLEQTVNINSGSNNPAGVKKVGAVYKKLLEEIGCTTNWIDMPEAMHRGGHLIAEIKGSRG